MSTVLTNANIYTMDKKQPRANTIVYEEDIIKYVGDDEAEWRIVAGNDPDIYDLNGKMLIPGFIDSHIHPGLIAKTSWHVKMPWTENVDEILAFIKDYAEKHPVSEVPFLYFEYYPSHIFDAQGPCKEMLDEAVSDRPCMVQDIGEHMHWMNSKMLEMMEVTKDTPDPTDLTIFVRREDGEPTGLGKEYVWFHFADTMYDNIGWKPAVDLNARAMFPVFDFYTKHGVTAMAEGYIEGEDQIIAMKELDEKNQLNTYYDGCVRCDNVKDLIEKIEELRMFEKKYSCKHMKFNTMKLFLDGTNESGNSAVLEPYINDNTHDNYGIMGIEEDEVLEYLEILNKEELDLHVHVVGDRAFRTMCNAYERLINKIGKENVKTQLILAHCELVDPSDMLRPAELGITINWTPRWSGGVYGEKAKIYLGEERWNRMYQFNPMIDSGALIAFSGDLIAWGKIDLTNPFHGMQIGHTRIDPVFPLDPAKFPNSMRPMESAKLSREILLEGYTINGAKQMRWDNIMGSLEVGKLANLCVISDNYFEVAENKIKDIKFLAVVFEGKTVSGNLKT